MRMIQSGVRPMTPLQYLLELSCSEADIADTTSTLTVVGGRIVSGAGEFARLDDNIQPSAMPDWSLVSRFGGSGSWHETRNAKRSALTMRAAHMCGRANQSGHDHATAWSSKLPIADLKSLGAV